MPTPLVEGGEELLNGLSLSGQKSTRSEAMLIGPVPCSAISCSTDGWPCGIQTGVRTLVGLPVAMSSVRFSH
jgi:hypothetical protein